MPLKPNDKIAIVGAGPAGIHMAYELKKMGYNNLTVFEKENRVGGKSYTVERDGAFFDFGTLVCITDFAPLAHLVSELDLELLPLSEKHLRIKVGSKTISPKKYIYSRFVERTKRTRKSPWSAASFMLKLLSEKRTYKRLKMTMVDEFGFPKIEYKNELKQPFSSWLRDNELDLMHDILLMKNNSWGVSNDLAKMTTFKGLVGPAMTTSPVYPCVKGGFQSVWEKCIQKKGIAVRMGTEIKEIYYVGDLDDGDRQIEITSRENAREVVSEKYDALFYSIRKPLQIISNPPMYQREIFKHINVHSSCPAVTTLYSCRQKASDCVLTFSPGSSYRYPIHGLVDQQMLYPDSMGPGSKSLRVAFQFIFKEKTHGNIEDEDLEHARAELLAQLRDEYGESDIELLQTVVFPDYGTCMRPDAIDQSMPWRLHDSQGLYNTWFIGEGAYTGGIPNIMAHNLSLLERI